MSKPQNPKMNYKVECPYHPNAPIIEDYAAGDVICTECGLVIGDRVIDVTNEWRSLTSVGHETFSADPCRCGPAENPLFAEVDLSTAIGAATGPAGLDEKGGAKYQYKRPVKTAERVMAAAIREISAMADRINLPQSVVDRANNLFKLVRDNKTVKGSHDAIATSCLYLACKQESVPRSLKEICAVSKVSAKLIGRCFKLIIRAVDTNSFAGSVASVTSGDLIARFAVNLGLGAEVKRAAICIAEKAREQVAAVSSKSPHSIAGAAIYMALQSCGDKKSKKEIGEIVGVSESTIKMTYIFMLPQAAQLFPEDFVFATPIAKFPKN